MAKCEFGEVLVCDWGLARYLGELKEENLPPGKPEQDIDSAGLTRHSGAFGTRGFMAPEQVTQKRYELDKAADIYALGSILYNILSGKSPFSGKAPRAKMILTAQGKIPPPATKSVTELEICVLTGLSIRTGLAAGVDTIARLTD